MQGPRGGSNGDIRAFWGEEAQKLANVFLQGLKQGVMAPEGNGKRGKDRRAGQEFHLHSDRSLGISQTPAAPLFVKNRTLEMVFRERKGRFRVIVGHGA